MRVRNWRRAALVAAGACPEHRDSTLAWGCKARSNRVEQSGFARTGGANQRNALALLGLQADICQRHIAIAVGKPHVMQ